MFKNKVLKTALLCTAVISGLTASLSAMAAPAPVDPGCLEALIAMLMAN